MRWLWLLLLFWHVDLWAAPIGDVTRNEGTNAIERKGSAPINIGSGTKVESMDTVKTGSGSTTIQFVDETRVDVTANSKLIIDEFVYDPKSKKGKISIEAGMGTMRYASGQIAKTSQQEVKISTPTAVIGVRGTDFSMTVDELGGSTIILLPSCTQIGKDRVCLTGEISVSSDVGMVIMNQAFQATTVETKNSSPLKPTIIQMDEKLIDNMLIVRRPVEITEARERERVEKLADFLKVDLLAFSELQRDYLAESQKDIWMTDLDIDFLDQDFLADVLDQVNAALARQMINQLDEKKQGSVGKDPNTGIELMDQHPQWLFRREDAGNRVQLRLSKNHGYNINLQQNEFEYKDYKIGDGKNEIHIKQVQ